MSPEIEHASAGREVPVFSQTVGRVAARVLCALYCLPVDSASGVLLRQRSLFSGVVELAGVTSLLTHQQRTANSVFLGCQQFNGLFGSASVNFLVVHFTKSVSVCPKSLRNVVVFYALLPHYPCGNSLVEIQRLSFYRKLIEWYARYRVLSDCHGIYPFMTVSDTLGGPNKLPVSGVACVICGYAFRPVGQVSANRLPDIAIILPVSYCRQARRRLFFALDCMFRRNTYPQFRLTILNMVLKLLGESFRITWFLVQKFRLIIQRLSTEKEHQLPVEGFRLGGVFS